MNPSESEHEQFLNQMAAYLANGLSDEERVGFEEHAADCDACAQELAKARADERDLRSLFADQNPAPDFEAKLIASLRAASASRWLALPRTHPFVRHAAAAVAASLLVATVGYLGNEYFVHGSSARVAANLRNIGKALLMYSNDNKGIYSRILSHDGDGQNILWGDGHVSFEHNPFTGVQRDNISTTRQASTGRQITSPFDRGDSVLMPSDGDDNLAAKAQQLVTQAEAARADGKLKDALDQQDALARRQGDIQTRRQYSEYAFNIAINQAKDAVRQNDFEAASEALNRARVARDIDPSMLTPEELAKLDATLNATGESITQAEVKFRNVEVAQIQNEANQQLRTRLSAENQAKRDTVRDLIRTARQYVEQAKYREALGVVDQILTIDPQNDYAIGTRPLIEDRALHADQRKSREGWDRSFRSSQPADEKRLPSNDILRAPDNWPELGETRNKSVAVERGALILDQHAAVQLDRALPEINFNQIAFSDVVEFLRDITQANIYVNWAALDGVGIDRNTRVTAHLKNVKLSNAIAEILHSVQGDKVKLGFVVTEGVIAISTSDDLAKSAGEVVEAQARFDPSALANAATTQPSGAGSQSVDSAEARSIIRTGTMEFEVENFDAAFEQIRKIVLEARGYIGTINSERMPNGKVHGTVTLRVPPEATDDVIAKLRPLGEIKRQNLAAEEVTKQIADLSRQLETANTMQHRLGELISASTTQPVKDRVSAEREAGEWRTKAQHAQGQIAALKNQVALATVTVVLNEKGLEAAAVLRELESVDMSVETEDVERSRADATKAIDEMKGRIVESQLKQLDAGQLTAKVVAEVSSDRATEVIDRLKQLGKVARLDAQRQTTTSDNRPATPGAKVERKDTRIVVAFYNVANVPPRVTSSANIACENVEATYRAISEHVIKVGGRVISSNVNRQQADRATATMQFEVKSDQADAVLNDLRVAGELMKLDSVQNNDTNSVTSAKRGFAVQLVSIASAAPRQVTTKSVAAVDVPKSYNVLLDAAGKMKARIVVSKLQQDSNQPANAWLDFEVRKDDVAAIDAAIAGAGDSVGGDVTVSTDTANTLASKVQYKIALSSADQLPPREMTTMGVEARDVEASAAAIARAASEAGGRAIDSNVSKESSGRTTAKLVVDVPLDRAGEIIGRIKSTGAVRISQSTKYAHASGGQLARARIDVTFGTPESIVGADAGVWATIRNGLSTSAAGLMWSLRLLVIGVCLIAPWAAAVWGARRIAKRVRAGRATAQ